MENLDGVWWQILVDARVELLPTAAGGKTRPIYEGYSPNHKLKDGLFCMGRFASVEGGQISPGESALVEIKFVVIDSLRDLFKEGLTWDIHEGSKRVGTGQVLSVVEAKQMLE